MPEPAYQAVIFDMDGLIVDSETIYYNAYNQTLNDLGVDIPREEYMRCVGHPVEGNSAEAVKIYDLPIRPEDFLESWMKRFENAIGDPEQIELMPGFLDLIAHLRQKKYKLGIASSTPRHRMQTTLKNGVLPHLDVDAIDQIFSALFSGSDVTNTKPDPEIYLKAAAKLDVEPKHCIVFEDSSAGVQSAKAAGMTSVAVPNFFTAHHDHSQAHHILKSLHEAIPML
ncbi:MAG: HAD family phosphatase [Candidatus Latescibacteria bacterium]|nr:HAD family phosphatase [Candidatus Latescibacterota bacterium]MBT4139482.1 HAD family phosphatase [Candidatus Latescibacterota bacterium]MBT5829163.1 HAD family phosphatase [Candidatus Latescibacterota bacterium]